MSEYARRHLAVLEFSRVMREKLVANIHKGDWSKKNPYWLLDLLKEEVTELEDALDNGTPEEIAREAADIANFAMMISDVVSQRSKV